MQVKSSHLSFTDDIMAKWRSCQLGSFHVNKLHANLIWSLKRQYLKVGWVAAVVARLVVPGPLRSEVWIASESKRLFILLYLGFTISEWRHWHRHSPSLLRNFDNLCLKGAAALALSVKLPVVLIYDVSDPGVTVFDIVEADHTRLECDDSSLLVVSNIDVLDQIVWEKIFNAKARSHGILCNAKSSFGFNLLASRKTVCCDEMCVVIHKLENTHEPSVVSNN